MKKNSSLIIFIIGLIVLAAGGAFLAVSLLSKPQTADAEYLVQIGAWTEEGTEDFVIWNFTEIGKGTLTTNNHQNDYDFLWAIDGDTLKIETAWLYDLENEYTFKIDRSTQKLTLTDSNSKTVTFSPSSSLSS